MRRVAILLLLFWLGLLPMSLSGQPSSTQHVLLPTVMNMSFPVPFDRGVLGVEVANLSAEGVSSGVQDLQPAWVRRYGLHWKDVEPTAGAAYNWNAPSVQALEADMIAAAQLGLRLIVVIHKSPAWAVAPYRADCAPISRDAYDDFVRFVQAAVERYSQPPYNVRFWEIGNEPDAYVFEADAVFGCWGLAGDPYYGGQAYGELLKQVYPAVKAVDPDASLLNGGLLLGQAYNFAVPGDNSWRFFEGMLLAGAGDAFDMLSYHSYSFYNGSIDGSSGEQDWKPGFLRSVMKQYGINKPLILTESALLCTVVSDGCADAQADYAARTLARAYRDDLAGIVWFIYDQDAFNSTALIEPGNPALKRPAYAALRHGQATLQDATYIETLSDQPEHVEALHFQAGATTIYVVWSSSAPTSIAVPVAPGDELSCSERDGSPVDCALVDGNQVQLVAIASPRYVVYAP